MRLRPFFAALLLLGTACRVREINYSAGTDGGTMIVSMGGDPDVPIPMLTTTVNGIQVGSAIFERLAEPGPDLNTMGDEGFRPVLADQWTWAPDSLSIAFHLNPKARWHDGAPVTARDVRFTFETYRDPATGSSVTPLITNIDSVTVRDSLTAVFWYHKRYSQQFFDATYQMFILPEHLLGGMKHADIRSSSFARHPIGTGPFRFSRWIPGSLFEVVADTTHYSGRPHLDRIIWTISPDYVATTTKLFAGQADFVEYLRPEALAELTRHPELKLLRYPSLNEGYVVFNLRDPEHPSRPHPIFGDRNVRRALSMAVDRRRLVANVFDSLAVPSIGPEVRPMATADTTIAMIPYDPAGARRLLDSLGWRDHDGDGVRDKNGKPLHFTLLAPTSSAVRVRISVLLQQMFAQVGAKVDIEQAELNLYMDRQHSRKFDAMVNSLFLDPSPSSIRQTWGVNASNTPTDDNIGSYVNPVLDALLDSAATTVDPAIARALYRRAYKTIIDDAPAIWLYEVLGTGGISKRIHPDGIRADGWWVDLGAWYIPDDQRIARDRIGVAEATP